MKGTPSIAILEKSLRKLPCALLDTSPQMLLLFLFGFVLVGCVVVLFSWCFWFFDVFGFLLLFRVRLDASPHKFVWFTLVAGFAFLVSKCW